MPIPELRRPVVGILQPSYLPWLGAFDLMAVCDIWIFYDDVQYTRRDWRNRNRIKTARGPEYLTVPVRKAPRDTSIRDIEIHDDGKWGARHLAKLEEAYADCPQRKPVLDLLRPSLARPPARLAPLCTGLIRELSGLLGIRPTFLEASGLACEGVGQERILALCQKVGAASYVNGAAGRALYDADRFEAASIDLVFQDYSHPEYAQPHPPFASHLSVVDLLMSYSPEEARRILRSGSNLP